VQTFEQLAVEPLTPALHETIHGFAHAIAEHPVEVRPGVAETLRKLAAHHRLIIMTKGDIAEQTRKVEGSGLKPHFLAVEIVAEKDAATYLEIVAKHSLPKPHTWMIGNSPKSDINPALAAGINAVFVPHDQTWVLEHEEVCEPPRGCRLLIVEQFGQLTDHF
jgi:putative hydrolase of the HAD superfamily